jgi:hypothetical protein
MAKEYVFLDEWDVDAPQEAVFEAIADARAYPEWWKPVYIEVEGDQPPGPGVATRHHFKGKLPYTLKTTSPLRLDRPCRPATAPLPHPDPAPDLPLEPQLVGGPREGGPRAVRPQPVGSRL